MGFVLRDVATGLFHADNGWTSFPSFARKFPDQEQAEKAARSGSGKNFEIVIVRNGYVAAPRPEIQPPNT